MRQNVFDPRRLDVAAFIDAAASLKGSAVRDDLLRLADGTLPPPEPFDPVPWQVRGERRRGADRQAQRWLHVLATGHVTLTCQRCLEPLGVDLAVDRWLRFVDDEAEAERLDLESEDDVLALTRRLDLIALIEDELLLALPVVPRHSDCSHAWTRPPTADPAPQERPNPFAALRSRARDE